MLKWLKILLMLHNPRIVRTPLRVLRELRRRGLERLPGKVGAELRTDRPGLATLRYVAQWLSGENPTRHQGRWVLNSFLPPMPSQAFDNMFLALLSGRHLSPVSAFLAPTARCAFHCPHCSARQRPTGELPTAAWLNVIRQLHDLQTAIIGFTGGDPILREDLPELIQAAADGGSAVILFTTGQNFDRSCAERLRQAGLWAVCFSLDWSEPAAFNAFRGQAQAFAMVEAAVQAARRAGLYTMLGAVATPDFVEKQEYRALQRLGRAWGLHELRLVESMPCGNWRRTPESQLLTPDQVSQLRHFHVSANQTAKRPTICAFNQIESQEFFGCAGGTQHLYIDSAGAVCPCDFTPLSFGSITSESLEDIWLRMTQALGNPRRECLIRKHHRRLDQWVADTGEYPLHPENSCRFCDAIKEPELPDYFKILRQR